MSSDSHRNRYRQIVFFVVFFFLKIYIKYNRYAVYVIYIYMTSLNDYYVRQCVCICVRVDMSYIIINWLFLFLLCFVQFQYVVFQPTTTIISIAYRITFFFVYFIYSVCRVGLCMYILYERKKKTKKMNLSFICSFELISK